MSEENGMYKNASVRECLGEAVDIIEGILEGSHSPDSATTQPWKRALREENKSYMSLSEYNSVKSSGLLWELHPEFTGDYLEDIWKQIK